MKRGSIDKIRIKCASIAIVWFATAMVLYAFALLKWYVLPEQGLRATRFLTVALVCVGTVIFVYAAIVPRIWIDLGETITIRHALWKRTLTWHQVRRVRYLVEPVLSRAPEGEPNGPPMVNFDVTAVVELVSRRPLVFRIPEDQILDALVVLRYRGATISSLKVPLAVRAIQDLLDYMFSNQVPTTTEPEFGIIFEPEPRRTRPGRRSKRKKK